MVIGSEKMSIMLNVTQLSSLVLRDLRIMKLTWFQSIFAHILTPFMFLVIIYFSISDSSNIAYYFKGVLFISIINASFSSSANTLFLERFERGIEVIYTSPISPNIIILGYIIGSFFRMVITVSITYCLGIMFNLVSYCYIVNIISCATVSCIFSSMLGILTALVCNTFNAISVVQTLLISPLLIFSGALFEVSSNLWAYLNPFFYFFKLFQSDFLLKNNYACVSMIINILLFVVCRIKFSCRCIGSN